MATACFQTNSVMYLISGFLPGEYVLRVFPLINKSTQSHRLSLALFGTFNSERSMFSRPTFELEGPIYGVYSKWRDYQKILMRGHTVYALQLDNAKMFCSLKIPVFPSVERLSCVASIILFPYGQAPVFTRFPRLTQLEVGEVVDEMEELLDEVWKLPLTSLIINYWNRGEDEENNNDENQKHRGSPAFAETLRTFQTDIQSLVGSLSPYCRNLRRIGSQHYHKFMAENPGLTSLTLWNTYVNQDHSIDLTRHPQLMQLELRGGCPVVTKVTLFDLIEVSLENPHESAVRLLQQCPGLQRVRLSVNWWEDIIEFISVLDPAKCELIFRLSASIIRLSASIIRPPSFDNVLALVNQGFRINENFFLETTNPQRWEKTVEMAPNIKNVQVLSGGWLDKFLKPAPASWLSSFHQLSVFKLNSYFQWNRQDLASVVKSCLVLKELHLSNNRLSDGADLELESQSLCKLELQLIGLSGSSLKLRLPSLTHLGFWISGGEGEFLQVLLGGNPSIHVPVLRVLHMFTWAGSSSPISISCEAGHSHLTQLTVEAEAQVRISSIRLRNLPSLKALKFNCLPDTVKIVLDVPGACDISLGWRKNFSRYLRQDVSQETNFNAILTFDVATHQWVEDTGKRKKRKVAVKH